MVTMEMHGKTISVPNDVLIEVFKKNGWVETVAKQDAMEHVPVEQERLTPRRGRPAAQKRDT